MPRARAEKFFELRAASFSPMAADALQRIDALYTIERQAATLTPEARLQLRGSQALPALADLQVWLQTMQPAVAPGSGTRKAIEHALKHWPALVSYADSGIFPIDNNAVENTIRPIAIGKKNWLIAGSERAGRRVAASQTLLGTAKPNLPRSAALAGQRIGTSPDVLKQPDRFAAAIPELYAALLMLRRVVGLVAYFLPTAWTAAPSLASRSRCSHATRRSGPSQAVWPAGTFLRRSTTAL